MSLSNNGLVSLLTAKMGYLGQKQSLHAENISHANLPGYKAREIVPFAFCDALKKAQMGMVVTDAKHIVPASLAGTHAGSVEIRDYDASPDGNTVDVEQELMKVSATGVEYQLVTSLYKKVTGLMKIALKGNSS